MKTKYINSIKIWDILHEKEPELLKAILNDEEIYYRNTENLFNQFNALMPIIYNINNRSNGDFIEIKQYVVDVYFDNEIALVIDFKHREFIIALQIAILFYFKHT